MFILSRAKLQGRERERGRGHCVSVCVCENFQNSVANARILQRSLHSLSPQKLCIFAKKSFAGGSKTQIITILLSANNKKSETTTYNEPDMWLRLNQLETHQHIPYYVQSYTVLNLNENEQKNWSPGRRALYRLHSQLNTGDKASHHSDEAEVLEDGVTLDQVLLGDVPCSVQHCPNQTQHVPQPHRWAWERERVDCLLKVRWIIKSSYSILKAI